MQDTVRQAFRSRFQKEPLMFIAPGRINVIGEHIDYNEGFVLPAAIDKGIVFAVAPNGQNFCRLMAIDLNDEFECSLGEIQPSSVSWANYLLGVIDQLQKHGHHIGGFDCAFGGNIPVGAGLSSSAAVECGLAGALNRIFDLGIDKMDLVKLAQKAEHTYPGVQCGIMDQFASTFGKSNHVVRLDCRSLEYRYFPFDMSEYRILLMDTKVSHSLADSEYNTRRQECETGVAILQRFYPEVRSLRDVTIDQLEAHRADFSEIVFQRCRYVVEETSRVLRTCEALERGDTDEVGRMMYASHHGLQHEYEVSCPELDFLVDQTRNIEAVRGSRMMGGGFGGCTINLVRSEEIETVASQLSAGFEAKFGRKPGIYITSMTDGVRPIEE